MCILMPPGYWQRSKSVLPDINTNYKHNTIGPSVTICFFCRPELSTPMHIVVIRGDEGTTNQRRRCLVGHTQHRRSRVGPRAPTANIDQSRRPAVSAREQQEEEGRELEWQLLFQCCTKTKRCHFVGKAVGHSNENESSLQFPLKLPESSLFFKL